MKILLKILLDILKWSGILIGGILVLLVLLLHIPLGFAVMYADHGLTVGIRIFGLNIPLKVGKKRSSGENDASAQEEKDDGKPEKKKSGGLSFSFGILWDILNEAGGTLVWLLKRISILDIDVALPIDAGDPFLTGTVLGAAWSAAGRVMALLARLFRKTTYVRMDFDPVFDPLADPPAIRAGAVIHGMPVAIAAAGLIIYVKYLKITRQAKKENENVTEQ